MVSKQWYPQEPPIGTRYIDPATMRTTVWMGWAERIESKTPAQLPPGQETPDAPLP